MSITLRFLRSTRLIFVTITFLVSVLTHIGAARADVFTDRTAFWEESAFLCKGPASVSFPSKEASDDAQKCDDGDMTFFNGLLCASGDQRGCEGVRLAQDPDGRWWRSPRRIGWEAPAHDVSFSPDQALGVMLYLVTSHDAASAKKWIKWLNDNRPVLSNLFGVEVKGWPRYCRDDSKDKRCTFRPNDCVMLQKVMEAVGTDGALCPQIVGDVFPAVELSVLGSATINSLGYPLHLAAVQILLLQKLGIKSDAATAAARMVASRQPNNPFFRYLADGPTSAVVELVLSQCPNRNAPSGIRLQWSWEREESEQAWLNSMYWDCLFMANLLTSK